jgi:hypothetical protein
MLSRMLFKRPLAEGLPAQRISLDSEMAWFAVDASFES